MNKIKLMIVFSFILSIISCKENTDTKNNVEERQMYTEIQQGTDDGTYIGTSSDKVGNISIVYLTVENGKMKSVLIDELGHAHGGIIAGVSKRNNKEYEGYMMREANISWTSIITNVEAVIIEKQSANIEDIDALSGATAGFTSDNLALKALKNAVTVAKESSDFFRLEQ